MSAVKYRGWSVDVTCIVNCSMCGCSNVDMAAGTPKQCVESACRNGWRITKGNGIVCGYCLNHSVHTKVKP